MTRLLFLLFGLALALPVGTMPARAQQGDAPVRPAKLMTLDRANAAVERRFYGRVRARQTVDLAFQVGGQITEFPLDEGSSVGAGDLVAELDLSPFRRELERARVNLAKAQRDLTRLQQLSADSVSDVQVEDARTQVDLARIALEQAEDRLEDATLAAPFDGLVARRLVATFTTVSAGQPIVRLHDMSEIRIDIDVPEVLFRRARREDDITIWARFPGDDTRYDLELREFEAETAQVGQTFRITLAFTQDTGEWLLPGASATVVARLPGEDGDAILLPETALVYGADGAPHVMVFEASAGDPDTGTVTRRAVEISVRSDARVALADGPAPGTEIVMTGASQLRDGQRVRRFTGIGE
jgi:RND family efflux transporter MFP subunit